MRYAVLLLVSLCCGFAAAKCKYRRNGDWAACSADGLRSRTDVLKAQKSDANCLSSRNITKVCREDCHYERRRLASWADCDQRTSTIAGTRKLVSGDGCPAQVTEVFDCRIQKRFSKAAGRRAGRKNQRKAQRKAQRRQNKQQNKEQRRLQRKQKRQQRRQNRQNRQNRQDRQQKN